MTAALHLDRVTKKYDKVVAVSDLSMSVEQGEMFGLIGPDGAGKTTAIRLMCGLLKTDGGSVRVLGRDPVKEHLQVTQAIGYLSQRFSLYGDLSIDENISFSRNRVVATNRNRRINPVSALQCRAAQRGR